MKRYIAAIIIFLLINVCLFASDNQDLGYRNIRIGMNNLSIKETLKSNGYKLVNKSIVGSSFYRLTYVNNSNNVTTYILGFDSRTNKCLTVNLKIKTNQPKKYLKAFVKVFINKMSVPQVQRNSNRIFFIWKTDKYLVKVGTQNIHGKEVIISFSNIQMVHKALINNNRVKLVANRPVNRLAMQIARDF